MDGMINGGWLNPGVGCRRDLARQKRAGARQGGRAISAVGAHGHNHATDLLRDLAHNLGGVGCIDWKCARGGASDQHTAMADRQSGQVDNAAPGPPIGALLFKTERGWAETETQP